VKGTPWERAVHQAIGQRVGPHLSEWAARGGVGADGPRENRRGGCGAVVVFVSVEEGAPPMKELSLFVGAATAEEVAATASPRVCCVALRRTVSLPMRGRWVVVLVLLGASRTRAVPSDSGRALDPCDDATDPVECISRHTNKVRCLLSSRRSL
jgi:hypothetical protein